MSDVLQRLVDRVTGAAVPGLRTRLPARFETGGTPDAGLREMPPFARVALILAKYAWLGIIPQCIPSLEGPPLPTERIPRQQDTDLAYFRALAEEAGYTFFMKPGPAPATSFAYWGPEIRIGEVAPALTVESGFSTNCERLSFSLWRPATARPTSRPPEDRWTGSPRNRLLPVLNTIFSFYRSRSELSRCSPCFGIRVCGKASRGSSFRSPLRW